MGSSGEISKELQFILAMLRGKDFHDPLDECNEDHVLDLLAFHGLIPPATQTLSKKEDYRNGGLFKALKNRSVSIAKRNLALLAEQQLLYSAFSREGVDMIFLKGIALAQQLYGDVAHRPTIDIDILVRPLDIKTVESIISRLGYERIMPKKKLSPGQWNFFIRQRKDCSYNNREKKITVEVHWGLSSIKTLLGDPPGFIWEEMGTVAFKSGQMPVMDKVNTLIYLCLHGIFHQYFRLFWLYDINTILHKWNDLDYEDLLKRCTELGIDRCIVSSCILANQLFDGPVPPVIHAQYQTDRVNRKIVRDCRISILKSAYPESSGGFRRTLYFMRLRRDLRHKVYCVTGLVIRKYIKWRFQ